ncbi:alpha/beta family hydrolase [uncultured Endozoicomonas sp.]|uniref:alpha/beta family hydrolase n=1 Tax=uncultured Endozoicomonas sp. TaxID=432652 RepID=UPI002608CF58|nr:alpha/beta family hydrolase [uncultured Endozoicomonas sp.]
MELIWNKASDNAEVLILAHGAGAAMDSEFMERMAELICESGVTVVRFEFDYMQQRRETGSRRPPDRQPKLLACWERVLDAVYEEVGRPLFIGGKSMGGRMATLLVAQSENEGRESPVPIKGVVCLGYPFYAAGKHDKPRIDHLQEINTPVLVMQGERDAMGGRETVGEYLLSPNVSIHWLADGNHDLKPRKVSGFSHEDHLQTSVVCIHEFCAAC